MIQGDIFWSYGFASGLALAAGKQLKKEKSPLMNKYFLASLLWNSCLLTPAIICLLWSFPSWETMFVFKGYLDLPGWLVGLFAFILVIQGALGFYVTSSLLQKGKDFAAMMQIIWSHAVTFFILFVGWDGTAYKRLLYVGTAEDWANGVVYPYTDFFNSPMFYTLLVIGVILVPPYFYLIRKWLAEARESHS